MGLLDFLKPRMAPSPGGSFMAYADPRLDDPITRTIGAGAEMKLPPQMTQQPGLMERIRTPNPQTGLSGADRFMMAMMALKGDPGSALNYGHTLSAETKAQQERQRKNEALKAAYGPDRKFDPHRYLDALGDAGDGSDAIEIARALAPKGGVDGGYAYKVDPMTGDVAFGEQRGLSHAEEISADRSDDMEAYRELMYKLAVDREARTREQGDARLGLARQREGRIGAGGHGGGHGLSGNIPPPPAGYRPVRP